MGKYGCPSDDIMADLVSKDLKETEEAISLHGLGFLQVKLQGKQRLHVWHPDLPRRRCFQSSAVHDHRFSFTSRVIIGTQINHIYDVRPAEGMGVNTHTLYKHEGARSRFGNRPWLPDGDVCIVHESRGMTETKAGEFYGMEKFVYHSTEPGGDGRVATIMQKRDEDRVKMAHSSCIIGVEPDVDFDRKQMSGGRHVGHRDGSARPRMRLETLFCLGLFACMALIGFAFMGVAAQAAVISVLAVGTVADSVPSNWPDYANGLLELTGGLMQCLSVRRLWRDRRVQGVDWRVTAFFGLWGLWNLFFYPSLDQWASFAGGILIVLANALWVGLALALRRGLDPMLCPKWAVGRVVRLTETVYAVGPLRIRRTYRDPRCPHKYRDWDDCPVCNH